MKRVIVGFVLGCLVSAVTVYAANVTLSFTAEQVAAAQWKYDQQTAAVKTEFPTLQLWFADQVGGMIAGWQQEENAAAVVAFCQAWSASSQAQRDAACSALAGGQPGCNPCP